MKYTPGLKPIIVLTVIMIIPLLLIGSTRCTRTGEKIFDFMHIKFGIWDLDGWSISHFILYLIVGYNLPDRFIEAMVVGTLWEGLESIPKEYRPAWFKYIGPCALTFDPDFDDIWWRHKWTDFVMNMFGFLAGKYLRLHGLSVPKFK